MPTDLILNFLVSVLRKLRHNISFLCFLKKKYPGLEANPFSPWRVPWEIVLLVPLWVSYMNSSYGRIHHLGRVRCKREAESKLWSLKQKGGNQSHNSTSRSPRPVDKSSKDWCHLDRKVYTPAVQVGFPLFSVTCLALSHHQCSRMGCLGFEI